MDWTKQKFTGSIRKKVDVFHSQGGMEYEGVLVIADEKFEFHDDQYHDNGQLWPQVKATFVLKRRAFQHILQTFFPACCLVVLSWISFLIPPYIVPGRMVLLVTILLVIFSTYQSE